MTKLLQCPKCLEQYKAEDLKHERCPACDRWLEPAEVVQQKIAEDTAVSQREKKESPGSPRKANEGNFKSDSGLAELIEAQDRTTYAVRSLALYFFINLTTGLLGGVLIYTVPAATIPGVLIVATGFIASVAIGISELAKSRP
jgi:hypothetical protein